MPGTGTNRVRRLWHPARRPAPRVRHLRPETPGARMNVIQTRSPAGSSNPTEARFAAVRGRTEALAAPLSAEDQCIQSMPDASPAKWHRAHVTWFFEEFVLRASGDNFRSFDDDFRFLFNSYYEAVGARHPRPERG